MPSRNVLSLIVLSIIIAGSGAAIVASQLSRTTTTAQITNQSSNSYSMSSTLSTSTGHVTSTSIHSTGSTVTSATSSTSSQTSIITTTTTSFQQFPVSFYVATDGNDSWGGTLPAPNTPHTDGPLATIGQAQIAVRDLKNAQPGRITPIVVEIEAGTYFLTSALTFSSADSGTRSAPIIYEAAQGASVVVSGGTEITRWTQISTSPDEWAASTAGLQNFEQLWMNGQRIQRPSTTSNSYLYFVGPVYSNTKTVDCSVQVGAKYECFDRFQFKNGDLQSNYYDINNVEIVDFECWTVPIMRLSSVDTANDTAYLTGSTSQNPMCHGFIAGHRFLVENVMENLKQPGQWYLDQSNARVLYIASPGENPNNEPFIAPQLDQLIVANGLDYVTFEGLAFSNSNWVVPQTGWISPQGEGLGSNLVPSALSFTDCGNITLDSDTISHTSADGIDIVGNGLFAGPTSKNPYNNQIVNSTLYDIGAGGIRIGRQPQLSDTEANVAQYNLIQNNVVEGIGRFLPAGDGIYVLNSHNNLISHNEIYDTYSNAISVGGTYEYNINIPSLAHDNVVQFNLVYNIKEGVTEDGGAIYTADGPAQGNKIMNNVVHDVTAYLNASINGYGGWGIYFDSTSQNVIAENNLVYRTSYPSIHQNDGFNNSVINNILAFGNDGIIDRTHNNASSLFVSHNIIYYDKDWQNGSFQRGIWTCVSTCASQFQFSDNLYWYLQGSPEFITDFPVKSYTLTQWQSLGEDQGSLVANPMFADPNFPTDNYTLLPNSPALGIGFAPFNSSEAGLFPSTNLLAPLVPETFPLQLLDQSNEF